MLHCFNFRFSSCENLIGQVPAKALQNLLPGFLVGTSRDILPPILDSNAEQSEGSFEILLTQKQAHLARLKNGPPFGDHAEGGR